MTKGKIALLATVLCVSAAVPAYAAYENVGRVEIGNRNDMRGRDRDRFDRRDRNMGDVKVFRLGGAVDSLQVRAEGSDISCRSVDATFENGRTRSVFNGDLREGRTVNVDMPGRERGIRSLDFNCMARGRGDNAAIRITADIGNHRDEWRRSPDWNNSWSKVFNWGSNAVNNWQMIGQERFEGRGDTESTFAGWKGQRTDAVALRPLETDARCSRVTARFDRGREQPLNVNNGDVLRRGQYYKLDLPGNMRNLESINMRCSAQGGRAVTMQIFVSK